MEKFRDYYKSVQNVRSECSEMWGKFLQEIGNKILTADISTYESWSAIRQSMGSGSSEFGPAKEHLDAIKKNLDWGMRWSPIFVTNKTASMANHSFYLNFFEQFVGIKIDEIENIFEFGAGFGNMCHLIHSLGFKGIYNIYDFPELLTIQSYYLQKNMVNGNINFINDPQKIDFRDYGFMFISTHALEESPENVMELIFSKICKFHYFLFVFSGGKNKILDFFNSNNIVYKFEELNSMKGHYIIAGFKK